MGNYTRQQGSSSIPFIDLCKKIEHLNFLPGVLKDIIYAVKQKRNSPHFCTISIDVHPVKPVIQFDNVSETFTGFVAPLSSEMKLAGEIVVFMLQGFEVEWKCLAGYMFLNFDEDGWAVWHILNQMVLLLAQYDFTVINVVFGGSCEFDILDNNVDEALLKGDSVMQHPYYERDILCFTKNVDDIVKYVSELLLPGNFNLPDEILKKYDLTEDTVSPGHLHVLIGGEALSSESVASWLFQRDREFPQENEMIDLKTEIFVLRMLWMWVNAMTFILDDDTLGFYSSETHIQTLRDTSWIFEVLGENATIKDQELLWSNMKRSSLSVLSLYDHYVGKGLVSCIRNNSFRSLSLHPLKSLVQHSDLSGLKPEPCSMLQFLRLVNSALLLHPNFAEVDFESGVFLADFLEHRRLYLPVDIEISEDLSDLDGLGLYYLSSRVVTKLTNNNECEKCKAALITDSVSHNFPAVWIDAVNKNGFYHPSMSVYDTLQWAESHFLNTDEDILRFHKPCTQLAYRIYGEMAFSIRSTYPSCHEILRKLLRDFMSIRLKMVAEDLTRRLK